MRHETLAVLSVACALAAAVPAVAQETGTPVFSAPYRAFAKHELGLSLSAPESADLGFEGFYSFASGRNDFGLRVGFLDDDTTDLVVGGRFRTRLITHSEDFPLDGAFTLGVGGVFYDGGSVVRVPIGLSLGRRIDSKSSGLSFVPYLQPVLVLTFSEGDSRMDFALGLGLDVRLTRRFDLRVSGAVGDLEGFAVGFAWVK
jgi:opacity protein-like surface antigen